MGRTEANRKNAKRSTGPRSDAGKRRSSQNALRHGLRSPGPLLPGECPAEWDAFRQATLQALRPTGAAESELAERFALASWRLRRASAFEAAVTAQAQDEEARVARTAPTGPVWDRDAWRPAVLLSSARRNLLDVEYKLECAAGALSLLRRLGQAGDAEAVDGGDVQGLLEAVNAAAEDTLATDFDAEDGKFLAGLGVPKRWLADPWAWPGWTARLVRKAVVEAAGRLEGSAEELLAEALRTREAREAESARTRDELRVEVARLEGAVASEEERARRASLVPGGEALDRLTRYEAHLSRQAQQTLLMLQRLQEARRQAEAVGQKANPAPADAASGGQDGEG